MFGGGIGMTTRLVSKHGGAEKILRKLDVTGDNVTAECASTRQGNRVHRAAMPSPSSGGSEMTSISSLGMERAEPCPNEIEEVKMIGSRDIDKLRQSGLIIHGAGKILCNGAAGIVGYCYATADGLFHVFDDVGNRLNVFASHEEARSFAAWYWRADGTVDPSFVPIKLQ